MAPYTIPAAPCWRAAAGSATRTMMCPRHGTWERRWFLYPCCFTCTVVQLFIQANALTLCCALAGQTDRGGAGLLAGGRLSPVLPGDAHFASASRWADHPNADGAFVHRLSLDDSTGDVTMTTEAFVNRYRNAWTAVSQQARTVMEETAKRRGRVRADAPPPVPLAELPVPVPISRFLWPQVCCP